MHHSLFLGWSRGFSKMVCLAFVGLASLANAETALDVKVSSHVVHLQHNDWTWTVVNEQGEPLPDVMVYTPRFGGSYMYSNHTVSAIAEAFKVPVDRGMIGLAIEDWIVENPEPLELPQALNVYGGIMPIDLSFRAWTDANGQYSERRFIGPDLSGEFRLFFKTGYRPVALHYDFTPPLQSSVNPNVVITLKAWPERLATLEKRPWVAENLTLQRKILERWRKPSTAQSANLFEPPTSGKDPITPWQEALTAFHRNALTAGANCDAAWLLLAMEFAPHRSREKGLDTAGEIEDLSEGRIYKALGAATQLAPEIAILRARHAMRQFVLSFPNGLAQDGWSLLRSLSKPDLSFNSAAVWTPEILEQYFKTLEPFAQDPFLALSMSGSTLCSGMNRGLGLLERSSPEIATAFFLHRAKLREALLRKYPTASWFAIGFDPWDEPYEKKNNRAYLQGPAATH